jgi:UDP-N-acetylmuramyl pentapeptide phosphotransferase/UDP-N-acetylglucosamine-1-phosphate transferase
VSPLVWLVVFAASALVSLVGTRALLGWLRRRAILDHPSARSSHAVPTPRGGGIAVIGTITLFWGALAAYHGNWTVAAVLALALVLAGLSWRDDVAGLPVGRRLAVQAAAVAIGVVLLPDALIAQGLLPLWADRLLAVLAWLWFVNLYNFMDGIDGIAGTETVALGLGLALLGALAGAAEPAYGLAVAGAAAGFLRWNWPPARVFLGDVGSVPLGFLLGWLLLGAAAAGQWAAALILPLYYLADATLTLARRALRGEKVWQAHRSHFYQQGARRLGGHAPAVRRIAALDAALVLLALGAARAPTFAWPALTAAAGLVGLLLWYLAEPGGRAPRAE